MEEVEFEGMRFLVFSTVYSPAEDSFMLAKYAATAKGRVLDMGTGCGICAITAAKHGADEVLGADINPECIVVAQRNAERNKAKCAFVKSDLFEGIPGEFDTIVFNPPYLPTSGEERLEGMENAAYDGGPDGRKVIDRFLKEFPKHLSYGGRLLMLDSSLDSTEKTLRALHEMGFATRVLESRRFFFEELSVIEARRATSVLWGP
jgi:release factor glutamine methyltransferase